MDNWWIVQKNGFTGCFRMKNRSLYENVFEMVAMATSHTIFVRKNDFYCKYVEKKSPRSWALMDLRFKGSVEWSRHERHFCSLLPYFLLLDFKFSNFVCPSELDPLIWFFLKNSFRKKKNIRKTPQNALAPSIFIVWSIVLKLGTPLLHIQAQNTVLQNF